MRQVPITITKEDYENSSKTFEHGNSCPLATAFKRVFGITGDEIYVGTQYIGVGREEGEIAYIKPRFNYKDYGNVRAGIEFHGTLTIVDEEKLAKYATTNLVNNS